MRRKEREEIERVLGRLGGIAATLRETADGLLEWGAGGKEKGEVSPWHAAGRLRKLADEIDGGNTGSSTRSEHDAANHHHR